MHLFWSLHQIMSKNEMKKESGTELTGVESN